MAKVTEIAAYKTFVLVRYDNGTEETYSGSVDDFKAFVAKKAARAREDFATWIAIADGLKTEPDITKSPVIGKEPTIDSTAAVAVDVEVQP